MSFVVRNASAVFRCAARIRPAPARAVEKTGGCANVGCAGRWQFSRSLSFSGLGLRRINHTVEVQDTPENRGMINKAYYLLRVEG